MPQLDNKDILASVGFDINVGPILDYIQTRPYNFSQEGVDSLLQQLRDVWNNYLQEGINNRETVQQLTQRIADIFRGTEREEWWRARRIARTESIGAANMSAVDGYRQAGVPYKTWLTMRDPRVRHSHSPMEEVTIPINQKFVVNGALMDAPGDPAGGPAEICNCRCTIIGDYTD